MERGGNQGVAGGYFRKGKTSEIEEGEGKRSGSGIPPNSKQKKGEKKEEKEGGKQHIHATAHFEGADRVKNSSKGGKGQGGGKEEVQDRGI